MRILILGAGACGLGAAYQLHKRGYNNWQVFERSDCVGGLSTSFFDNNGFTWDVGGHVIFSHYDCFDKAVSDALGEDYYEHQRESWVRILQTWVPYPFQNNVRHLPDDALQECIRGLKNLQASPPEPSNFHEWMYAVFGIGIVKYFMEPYNRKVWGVPLDAMSNEWISERVSMVGLARIERNIAEQLDDLSWGPNKTFKFPKTGGTGAIYEGIAGLFKDRVRLNHEMLAVDLGAKQVRFANGRVESYDVLINTAPLDVFVKACDTIPEVLISASEGLVHNGGLIVGLGFEERRDDTKCWMYFPENNSPFYRVTNFHNYSPFNVPDGDTHRYSSMMCETTYSSYKHVDKTLIIEKTVQGLINSGVIGKYQRDRLVSRYLIDIPYSYPVPTLGRDKALSVIQPYLESQDVFSRGRFGAWKYEVGNMDHSFMQGIEVVERILTGAPETVLDCGS